MAQRRAPRPRLARLRPGPRTLRRNAVALLLALLAAGFAGFFQVSQFEAVYQGGPLYALESDAQDSLLRLRDPALFGSSIGRDPRTLITIVAMDDKSIAELGVQRNWPRTYYARVLDNLLAAPPRVVVFDVGFFDPAPEDPRLVAAFERARARRPATGIVIVAAGGGNAARSAEGDLRFTEGLAPIPELAQVAEVAAANVVPDGRGIVRSMPMLARLGDAQRPTVGLAAVAGYLRRPALAVERPDAETLGFAGRQIPVDRSGLVRVNYFGPPSRPDTPSTTFRTVSFVDVLDGRAEPNTWRDGIVFVGLLGATGFADDYWTPVSSGGHKMAGVEIHANVAATLLSTQFLREAPLPLQLGLIFGLALLVGLLAANLGVLGASLSTLGVLGAFVLGNLGAFNGMGMQVALANPLLAVFLAFMAVTAYRVAVEQRQARALQDALASVIPASVAQEIARDPDRVRMGGERRTITVLFTDLKGFTTFAERVDPQLLSRIVTQYLDAMTAVVFKHGGTVDKFIGDAVMAFWNAPLDDPDHARHACEAALEMQAALRALGDKWEAEGLPRQHMRIGINTGPASVGNMGTSRRFAYTALGDTVNLAAGLEPLNNEYGTRICISQATLDAAGGRDRFLVRFLDLVAVKGKKEPVPAYELIGRADDQPLAERYAPVLGPYHRAMLHYQALRFEEAAALFRAAMGAGNGVDQPSAVYVERCQALAQSPPGPEWDGVYVMRHK